MIQAITNNKTIQKKQKTKTEYHSKAKWCVLLRFRGDFLFLLQCTKSDTFFSVGNVTYGAIHFHMFLGGSKDLQCEHGLISWKKKSFILKRKKSVFS